MPKILLVTSPGVIAPKGTPTPDVVNALNALATNWPIGVISNSERPNWFEGAFPNGKVQFVRNTGRQNGEFLAFIADHNNVPPHDVIVLGGSREDVAMTKNSTTVLLSAGWAITEPELNGYGLQAETPAEVGEVLGLVHEWPGGWFYRAEARYRLFSLSNVSGYNVTDEQSAFADRVVATVKQGGPGLKALLTIVSRSLLIDGIANRGELMFGVYPSSSSRNDDSDVLADFCHRLRIVAARVRFAKRGEPLFIRHKPSSKRSRGGGGDRSDPTEQIQTVHINPAYRGRVSRRNVIVLDDFTTYGVSFGVAAALLLRAGARTVTGVALGKFGKRIQHYDIEIGSDPCAPITSFKFRAGGFKTEQSNEAAQLDLRKLLK